jgi:hypothetical protein
MVFVREGGGHGSGGAVGQGDVWQPALVRQLVYVGDEGLHDDKPVHAAGGTALGQTERDREGRRDKAVDATLAMLLLSRMLVQRTMPVFLGPMVRMTLVTQPLLTLP